MPFEKKPSVNRNNLLFSLLIATVSLMSTDDPLWDSSITAPLLSPTPTTSARLSAEEIEARELKFWEHIRNNEFNKATPIYNQGSIDINNVRPWPYIKVTGSMESYQESKRTSHPMTYLQFLITKWPKQSKPRCYGAELIDSVFAVLKIKGVNVNKAGGKKGTPPLISALKISLYRSEHNTIIQKLLDLGANPNAQNNLGETALTLLAKPAAGQNKNACMYIQLLCNHHALDLTAHQQGDKAIAIILSVIRSLKPKSKLMENGKALIKTIQSRMIRDQEAQRS